MLAAAAAARGAGQRRRGADAADQHLRAVRGEDPAAPAGRLRATPCPVPRSSAAGRSLGWPRGTAGTGPLSSAVDSFPFPPPFPQVPSGSGLASHVHRLSAKASSGRRLPPSEGPAVLLAPQAPLSSGCASQRLRHSWDAAREVLVIDPSSPRPGSERFRAGSRRAAVAHAVLSRSLAAACLRCRPSRLPFAVPLTLVAPLGRLCPHRVTAHTAAPPWARPVGCTRPRPCIRTPAVPHEPSFPSPGDSLRPHL